MATKAVKDAQALALGGTFKAMNDDMNRLDDMLDEPTLNTPAALDQNKKIHASMRAMFGERNAAVGEKEQANQAVRTHVHSHTKNGKKVENPENDLDRTWNERLDAAASATKRVADIEIFCNECVFEHMIELQNTALVRELINAVDQEST